MEGLLFKLSQDGRKLQAICTPPAHPPPLDEQALRKCIDEEGFSDLYILNDACNTLINRYASGTPFTMDVGEVRDGTFSLAVSPDLMSVTLTITPPYGGNPATAEQILQSLKKEGIVQGVQEDIIRAAATACRALNKPVATGRPPTTGTDAQLVSLIPEMRDRCPYADDDEAVVDYRELGGIVSVKEGDPLMRRVPPTDGQEGMNIKGQVVPGIRGRDLQFASNLAGTSFSTDDPDLLVAAVAGQPVLVPNGVVVEPTVKVKNIDLSTGNLTFEGTLEVSGDIASCMVVKASGDIIVGGTTEAALLEAGGNVIVKGGMISTKVHATGSISALFAEKSHLHAGRDIFLRELSMQSELKAGSEIVVGEKGMKKGHIIGGVARAGTLVRAIVIGSPAGVPTRVEAGEDPDTREKLALIRQQMEDKQRESEEIRKAIAYMLENPSRMSDDALKLKEQARASVETELAELTRQKKRLQKRLETVANASIEVERTIFYGVQVVVADCALTVDDDLEGVTFRLDEGKIVY